MHAKVLKIDFKKALGEPDLRYLSQCPLRRLTSSSTRAFYSSSPNYSILNKPPLYASLISGFVQPNAKPEQQPPECLPTLP